MLPDSWVNQLVCVVNECRSIFERECGGKARLSETGKHVGWWSPDGRKKTTCCAFDVRCIDWKKKLIFHRVFSNVEEYVVLLFDTEIRNCGLGRNILIVLSRILIFVILLNSVLYTYAAQAGRRIEEGIKCVKKKNQINKEHTYWKLSKLSKKYYLSLENSFVPH